jgi:GntR family transcriptional regulator
MSTGFTDARPLQVRIADELRAKIDHGEYAPGQQLPTLGELSQQFKCSFAAIRKAIDLLKQQGVVITLQGRGTFVRDRPHARRHGIDRYSRSRWSTAGKPILIAEVEQQGHTADQLIRELAEVSAPQPVALRLGIEPGTPVWVRRRTTLIDDRPNQLADSYYELSLVRDTAIMRPDTGPGGGFARLEDQGIRLDRITEELAVRMPTGPESVTLQLPPGTPVVDLVRTTYSADNRPVEVMLAVIAGDMVTFSYDFPIPD